MASCESTGRELSFEWSHHRISSADSKVRVALQNSIKYSGSEGVKDFKYNDTGFALPMTRPSCCSDEHVKLCSLPGGRHDLVYSILLHVKL